MGFRPLIPWIPAYAGMTNQEQQEQQEQVKALACLCIHWVIFGNTIVQNGAVGLGKLRLRGGLLWVP